MIAPANVDQFSPSVLTVVPGTRHAWLAYVCGSSAEFIKDDLGEYVAFDSVTAAQVAILEAECVWDGWCLRRMEMRR